MSIEGRIAVDVGFTDSASSDGVQAVKRLSLTSTDSQTTGKVAIIAGTCGTAAVAIAVAPSTYRDADGSLVSFTTVDRFAFAASAAARCAEATGSGVAISSASRVALSDARGGGTAGFNVSAYSGTASFTVVVVGT
jgi:hypothetical protein